MKFIKQLLLYFYCLLAIQFVFAQHDLNTHVQSIVHTTASEKEKINKIKVALSQYENSSSILYKGTTYYELGVLFFKINSNKNAIPCFQKSIQFLNTSKKEYLRELNKSRYYLSWIYMSIGEKKKQLALLNEIIKDKGNDVHTINATIALAMIDIEKGDYYLALKRLNLKLAQKNSIQDEVFLKIRLIGIYAQMFEENGSEIMSSHIAIINAHEDFIQKHFTQTQLDKKTLFEFYNNLANIYEALADYKKALQFYAKSRAYFKEQKNETDYFYVLNNIGYVHAKEGKIHLALSCFQEIISNATDNNQIATAYDNYGYFSKYKPIDKIPYFEKAIQIILEQKKTAFVLPELETIVASGYQQDIMVYLVDLASNYVQTYKTTNQKIFLVKAKNALHLIDELVSIMRYETTNEQSKLFWIEKGVNTYLLGAEVSYLLNKPEDGFYFMEKNKALLLQENIKTYQAKLGLLVPEEIRNKESNLHYECMLSEKKLQQYPNNRAIKNAYIKKHKEFENFMDTLHNTYPEYHKLKQKIDIVPLQKMMKTIRSNECFVTYILNNRIGYGLFVDTNGLHFFKLNDVAQLHKNIQTLSKFYTQFSLDKPEEKEFQKISTQVFNTLFPFKNAFDKLKDKKLTIVADGALLHLPFEALCIDVNRKLKESYLINSTEISYLQSYSTFEKIKQWKNNASKKLLLTVPYQFNDKRLAKLTRSVDIVDQLKHYVSTTVLFDTLASKHHFKEVVNDYEIVHLNTHAGIDNSHQMPWIAFRNSKMTLDELYGIPNQAELVILDACKTNEGQILSGEGIFSLSRGFFMNGTKSVLSSLWNVNEKSGNEIISSFYAELEKGNSKSKALQLAKIKYLKKHQLTEIYPYHWASFVLTGETSALQLKQQWYYNKKNIFFLLLIVIPIIVLVSKYIFLKK